MTAPQLRLIPPSTQPRPPTPSPGPPPSRRLSLAQRQWLAHRRSAAILAPLLAVIGVLQAINLSGYPAHLDDEGTYTAQAYAVQHYGSLAHYTYWYDHPPLGWIQISAYTWLTDAFDRYASAVDAGRESMLLIQLISAALLWVVCRRLLMARWSSALAVALFSLSPLALQYHRMVYLDNVATPWVLGALALALTPRKRLSAFVGSALCFAIAVLSKETSLLVLPVLVIVMWRATRDTGCRRYALTLAATTFALTTGSYVAYAAIKNELLPGSGHVSLWNGITFQLFTRQSSGSIFQPGTRGYDLVDSWLSLDTVLPVAALLALPVALFVRRLQPMAVGLAILVAMMVKPGYLPVPYVVAMIPFAALVVAGLADTAVGWRPARLKVSVPAHRRRPPLLAASCIGLVALAGFAIARWRPVIDDELTTHPEQPIAQSTAWVVAHVPRRDKIAVDDAYWVDLVRAGFPRDNVVWYYKTDTDPAVARQTPHGWRDYQYLVLTQSIRDNPQPLALVDTALAHSVVVARFGTGTHQIVIRRIEAA